MNWRIKPLDAILEQRHQKLVLRFEIEINGAVGNAGRLGDLAHPRRVETLLCEDAHRGGEDPLALVAATWRPPLGPRTGTAAAGAE